MKLIAEEIESVEIITEEKKRKEKFIHSGTISASRGGES
jgi:hypothetical protein